MGTKPRALLLAPRKDEQEPQRLHLQGKKGPQSSPFRLVSYFRTMSAGFQQLSHRSSNPATILLFRCFTGSATQESSLHTISSRVLPLKDAAAESKQVATRKHKRSGHSGPFSPQRLRWVDYTVDGIRT